jgi:hypothetical protein
MQPLTTPIRITLRVPGNWSHPGELVERLPEGYRLTPEALIAPDGNSIEFTPMPPDGQFARVFASACRGSATEKELDLVARYTVKIGLSGPGGSLASAHAMMQAAAAIVRAGGSGVFIDNSAIAHVGESWLAMTEDGGSDAISYAFANVVRGKAEIYTMGMHTMGFAELALPSGTGDEDAIVELLRWVCLRNLPIDEGDVLGDDDLPQFKAVARADSPLYNPFGRLKILSLRDIADNN